MNQELLENPDEKELRKRKITRIVILIAIILVIIAIIIIVVVFTTKDSGDSKNSIKEEETYTVLFDNSKIYT